LPPVSTLDRKEIAVQLLSTDPDDRTNVQMVAPDHVPASNYHIAVRPDNAPIRSSRFEVESSRNRAGRKTRRSGGWR
jgi:hypothetical protein